MVLKFAFIVVLCLVAAIIPHHTVGAFDTGHHWDITYGALSLFGFSSDTIRIIQAINWMTDFYSMSVFHKISDLQLLHCDTLRNTSEVRYFLLFLV